MGRKHRNYWNEVTCREEAKKYNKRADFFRNAPAAYNMSRKNGWLDSYDWFVPVETLMENLHRKWTFDACYEEAMKYTTIGDFRDNSKGAYESSRLKGWLSQFSWLEKKNRRWDFESCREEAKKYGTRSEFSKECGGAYNMSLKNGWLDEFFHE